MAMKKGQEPRDSEFSHGRGLMSPLERGYEPTGYEQLHALYRMDSVDPESVPNYDGVKDRTDRTTTKPIREKGMPTA